MGFIKSLLEIAKPKPSQAEEVVIRPSITVTVTNPSDIDGSLGYSPNQAKANELASQAVQLKDIQLTKSIELLREAYKLWPDNTDIAFRLARYLRQNGCKDEAFSIYRQLTTAVDPRNFITFGHSHSSILSEMMKQLYEEKRYNYYLYYHMFEFWNNLIGLATQGLYPTISEDFFETYGPQTKIAKALKTLGLSEERPKIKKAIYHELIRFDDSFRRLSELAKQNQFPLRKEVSTEGSIGERQNAALLQNEEFVKLFGELSCPTVPNKLWKDIFTPLLKQADEIKI